MKNKIRLLFVCTSNILRSPTAENIYKNDIRFEVLSCGTDKDARVIICKPLIQWADFIICMEKEHEDMVNATAGKYWDYQTPRLKNYILSIKDDYDYMQPELIELIKEKMSHIDFGIES
jgi:predicted protein tyrosine phosphatase